MPLPLPQLDDRRYDDLVEEMRALIPLYAPEWTDHNASDPGIMLVELFAWLTEAIIYRLNRIPAASRQRFLQLLDPEVAEDFLTKVKGQQGPGDTQVESELADAFNLATRKIFKSWRAVTAENFEAIAKEANITGFIFSVDKDYASALDQLKVSNELRGQFQASGIELASGATVEQRQSGTEWIVVSDEEKYLICKEDEVLNTHYLQPVARAQCFPEIDLTACSEDRSRPGHVSLVVVGKSGVKDPAMLLKQLKTELDKRRLINTCLHVVGPRYVPIYVEAEVVLKPRRELKKDTKDTIMRHLRAFFSQGKGDLPVTQAGSATGLDGFEPLPFGRPVSESEVYQLVDEIDGVELVSELRLYGRPFCFCVTLSDAKPEEDPVEISDLDEGKLPDKLVTAMANRGIDLPSASSAKGNKEKNCWIIDLSSDVGSESCSRSGKSDLKVVRNGGLLDIYGPFKLAERRDGIQQIELPVDGLVCFDESLTKIDLRDPR